MHWPLIQADCGKVSIPSIHIWLSYENGGAGVWRWYSEDMLNCCKPLDQVRTDGIVFDA